MKTREELEKMFDADFGHDYYLLPEIKQFIFETIIPEVLKSVIPNPDGYTDYDLSDNIKKKLKELYGITL